MPQHLSGASTILRRAIPSVALLAMPLFTLGAAPAAEGGSVNLLEPNAGLMVWTLVVFVGLMFVLKRFAFKPLFAAVEAREKALEEAITSAKHDREMAAALLAEHRQRIESARNQAQQLIADGRSVSDKMRAEMVEETRRQQNEMLEQARRDIEGEKTAAIAELRREAVDMAIRGATKVIEQNLDSAGNRKIVDQFLSSLDAPASRGA